MLRRNAEAALCLAVVLLVSVYALASQIQYPEISGGVELNQRSRFNVVLIYMDDMTWYGPAIYREDLGENEFVTTPEIDALAKQGVRFDRAYSVVTVCKPSRVTTWTGRYPAHGAGSCKAAHNQFHNYGNWNAALPTFYKEMQARGWLSAMIGKWHIKADNTAELGFDYWVNFAQQGDYWNWTIRVDTDGYGGGAGTEYSQTNCEPDDPSREEDCVHLMDKLNTYAVSFINDNADRDFVLIVSSKSVHTPALYSRPDRCIDDLQSEEENYWVAASWSTPDELEPAYFGRMRTFDGDPDEADAREWQRWSDESINCFDENVGAIVDALSDNGILDDTMVIFTGDQGMTNIFHGFIREKRLELESSMRIPLIIRYPKWWDPNTVVSDKIVTNVDIANTILAGAGLPALIASPGQRLDEPKRTTMVYQSHCQYSSAGAKYIPNFKVVRSLNYKYVDYGDCTQNQAGAPSCAVECATDSVDRIFDMLADPQEVGSYPIGDGNNPSAVKDAEAELAPYLTRCYE